MEVTLFSVRFVFQQQRNGKGHAEGDNHPDNIVQQRTGLLDSCRQPDRRHVDVHRNHPCAADQGRDKRLHEEQVNTEYRSFGDPEHCGKGRRQGDGFDFGIFPYLSTAEAASGKCVRNP